MNVFVTSEHENLYSNKADSSCMLSHSESFCDLDIDNVILYDSFDCNVPNEVGFTAHQVDESDPSNDKTILFFFPSGITFNLSSQGSRYLEFFQLEVSRLITVGPRSSNYLLKTFLPLAAVNEPILYALVSWGGMFIDGKPNSNNYKRYMLKACKLLLEKHDMSKEFDKEEFFTILSFFLIAMSVEICSGDVSHWRLFLEKCKDLIKQHGGIKKVLQDFHFSNDIKWMISDLQFHDLLCSDTSLNGSSLMKEYRTIFLGGRLLETDNYGVDPYQGYNQPIYLILGEILDTKVSIKAMERQLEIDLLNEHNSELKNTDIFDTHIDCKCSTLRLEYYNHISSRVNKLRAEIVACQLQRGQMTQDLEEIDMASHIILFELTKYSCEIDLLQIEKIPPSSYKLQAIFISASNCLDKLIGTRMIPCLGFPLLMCGMIAYKAEDQKSMRTRMENILQTYAVGNMEKIYCIIKEAWKQNTDGNMCLDWAEISREKGWLLFSC